MSTFPDPHQLHRQSLAALRAEIDLSPLPAALEPVVVSMIQASGLADLLPDLAFSPDAAEAGQAALAAAAPILTDCPLVKAALATAHVQPARVLRTLDEPETALLAAATRISRAAASVERWQAQLKGSVVVIAASVTALEHLLEQLAAGGPRPALIIATPAGFVGAPEIKQALIDQADGIPYLTVRGRRGGSTLAAAAITALVSAALRHQ